MWLVGCSSSGSGDSGSAATDAGDQTASGRSVVFPYGDVTTWSGTLTVVVAEREVIENGERVVSTTITGPVTITDEMSPAGRKMRWPSPSAETMKRDFLGATRKWVARTVYRSHEEHGVVTGIVDGRVNVTCTGSDTADRPSSVTLTIGPGATTFTLAVDTPSLPGIHCVGSRGGVAVDEREPVNDDPAPREQFSLSGPVPAAGVIQGVQEVPREDGLATFTVTYALTAVRNK
jgi:hypothetical protein